MATIAVGTMRPYRGTRSRPVMHFPEDASATFIVGDVLTYSSTSGKENKVKTAGADPTVIVGVAAEAASGTEGNRVAVYPADEETEFLANIDDGTALTAAMVGTKYGIVADSTNKVWRVDTTDTTNTRVIVTELVDAVADTDGRVLFKFLNANRKPLSS